MACRRRSAGRLNVLLHVVQGWREGGRFSAAGLWDEKLEAGRDMDEVGNKASRLTIEEAASTVTADSSAWVLE